MKSKKTTIAKKMILSVIFVTFLVASLTSFIILRQDYIKEMSSVEKVLDGVQESFLDQLSVALYNEDEEQVSHSLKGILKLPGIVEVRVREEDEDEDLHSIVNKSFASIELKKRRALGPKREIDLVYKEEGEKGKYIGVLYVYSTLGFAKERIVKQIINFSIVQSSQVIVLALSIFLIFRSLVSRHLKKMAIFAETIDLNDLSGPGLYLDRKKTVINDELQDLTDSFNEMRHNLKMAHESLKDYAENLEDKVKAATQEIEDEKGKVSNLLNNMRQAVFLIDGNWIVIPPVSDFTNQVFEMDIIGKDVLTTVFKDMDQESEDFSDLKSALCLIYGDDEFQFSIIYDNLPKKIPFITKTGVEKILSISYIGLYNSDELLETIMLVVDDVTEKEKLEKEINLKKQESEKNIQLITEMANAEIEDIELFLTNSQNLIQSLIKLGKNAPTDISAIGEMFRFLHTLKGNSRIFNFNSISQLAHRTENQVTEIKTLIEEGESVQDSLYLDVVENLYNVSKEIMEVSGLAKKVFRIENRFEKDLLKAIFSNLIKLDDIVRRNIIEKDHLLHSGEGFKKRKEIFKVVCDNLTIEAEERLIAECVHNLKSYSKASVSFQDLNNFANNFENSLNLLKDLKESDLNEFSELFIDNLLELKDNCKSLYFESDLNRPITLNYDDWSALIVKFYEFNLCIDIKSGKLSENGIHLLDKFIEYTKSFQLNLLLYLGEEVKKVVNDSRLEGEDIKVLIAEIWDYVLLITKIDLITLNKSDMVDKEKNIIKKYYNESKNGNLKKQHLIDQGQETLVNNIFLQLMKKNLKIYQFIDNLKDSFEFDKRYEHLKDQGSLFFVNFEHRSILKTIRNDFKTSRIISDVPNKTKKFAKEGVPIAKAFEDYFKWNKRLAYLKLIDLYQILEGFTAHGAKEIGIKKAETWPVIVKNLKKLEHLIDEKADIHKISDAFRRLKDIPLVPNLNKFKTMVQDISLKLSKTVNFSVSGADVTLDKDAFNLLQDGIIHILRNCLDHGIELPEERTSVGKNGVGNIDIICKENTNGRIELIVKDDGKGINLDIISKKAIEKGLYTEETLSKLKEDEIMNIIFHPHFSQKEEVDELSGRGIGMDVVKKNLNKIEGEIYVESELGVGTSMKMIFNPGPPKS
ncbi:MAG: hypothetical protein CME68_09040 [Halobacteriovoraceae bacterium]|nr:hypothetical protein [Halobacteriovoraceae bacterium]